MTTITPEDKIYAERSTYMNGAFGNLKGKTVAFVRPLTKTECEEFAWDFTSDWDAMAMFFTDGTVIIPFQDPEGNGPGFLYQLKIDAEYKNDQQL